MAIYFAGGMYYPTVKKQGSNGIYGTHCETHRPMSFEMVHSGDKTKPYLTKSPKGLSLTSHHSSLYRLSDDMKTAELIDYRNGGNGRSPLSIELSNDQQRYIKASIDADYFFS